MGKEFTTKSGVGRVDPWSWTQNEKIIAISVTRDDNVYCFPEKNIEFRKK